MSSRVAVLGPATVPSPLRLASRAAFVSDASYILRDIEHPRRPANGAPRAFQKAGPREQLFFEPKSVRVGILSAGGICPGINDVIRCTVLELHHGYGVERIVGFRFGFAGLDPASGYDPIVLDPQMVRDIHTRAGTVLGTSRGSRLPSCMVDTLERLEVDVLLVIGGDGTMRAAHAGRAGRALLEGRLAARGHAVVVVAEGCPSGGLESPLSLDASGNAHFASIGQDVGRFLQRTIVDHFARLKVPLTLKYIDPSYMVRATRSSAEDAVFCGALARNAVHAAMAGKTDILVGRWHRCFTHVPLERVLEHEKRIDPAGVLWREVVEATGQPSFWVA